jgi:hypothetical protein
MPFNIIKRVLLLRRMIFFAKIPFKMPGHVENGGFLRFLRILTSLNVLEECAE